MTTYLEPPTDDRTGPTFELQDGREVTRGTLWQLLEVYGWCSESLETLRELEAGCEMTELCGTGVFVRRLG